MKCHTNINSIPHTQLPHKSSYIVQYLFTIILNHPIQQNCLRFIVISNLMKENSDLIKLGLKFWNKTAWFQLDHIPGTSHISSISAV
jgi:hypothetical protein